MARRKSKGRKAVKTRKRGVPTLFMHAKPTKFHPATGHRCEGFLIDGKWYPNTSAGVRQRVHDMNRL